MVGYINTTYRCLKDEDEDLVSQRSTYYEALMERCQKQEGLRNKLLKIEMDYREYHYYTYENTDIEYYQAYWEKRNARRRLLQHIRELPEELGGIYGQRRKFYTDYRRVIKWFVINKGILQASMIIDSRQFEQYALDVLERIKEIAEGYVRKICNRKYIFKETFFEEEIWKLNNAIRLVEGFKKKYVKNNGCFGLMLVHGTYGYAPEEYIAFSGEEDSEQKEIIEYFNLNKDRCRNLQNAIMKLQQSAFPQAICARTTWSVKYYEDVYGIIQKESIIEFKNRVPVISNYEEAKRMFSCCERKMLEAIKKGSAIITGIEGYSLFTRHIACEICQLALQEFDNSNCIHTRVKAFNVESK